MAINKKGAVILTLALGWIVAINTVLSGPHEIHPKEFYDLNGDGNKEAIMECAHPTSNGRVKPCYYDGKNITREEDGTHIASGFPIHLYGSLRTQPGFSREFGPRIYHVGLLDDKPGIDLRVSDPIDFPVTIDQFFSGIAPEPRKAENE